MAFKIIKTLPGEDDFDLFKSLPENLYARNSKRFILGNDPVKPHLEGCYLLLKSDQPAGRFAFYENPQLKFEELPAACIGSYECVDDENVSRALLNFTKEIAQSKGYKRLIGPMEGSTWQNYRFSDHNRYPNFFMEPYHHIYYSDQFKAAGFTPIAHYSSNLDETLYFDPVKIAESEALYLSLGATFRHLDMEKLGDELAKIGRFSNEAFAGNFLFTAIDPDNFVYKYLKLKKSLDPELVWIAENEAGEMQGLFFAIKDYSDPAGKTFIIKTMARKSGTPYKGLSSYLGSKIHQKTKQLGYTKAIHAFALKENISMQISGRFSSHPYKSYTLYGMRF